MKKRNDVKVVIGGKQYNMGGYESEEYLQSIASYINAKTDELKQNGGFPKLDSDIVNILLQINIADDYFKVKKNHNVQKAVTLLSLTLAADYSRGFFRTWMVPTCAVRIIWLYSSQESCLNLHLSKAENKCTSKKHLNRFFFN